MSITIKINPFEMDGEMFYTIRQFATIIDKSEATIKGLIDHGNRFRKLKVKRVEIKAYICASELTEFPFTVQGNSKEVYYYTTEGAIDADRTEIVE